MILILGLGTNINNRIENLKLAIQKLKEFLLIPKQSFVYESKALLPKSSSKEWDKKFLNMALLCEYSDSCNTLLKLLKQIEREMGRNINAKKWAPRIIDIDILVAENIIIETGSLKVPHQDLLNRDFALVPAAQIAPTFPLSTTQKTLAYHLSEMRKNNTISLKNMGTL